MATDLQVLPEHDEIPAQLRTPMIAIAPAHPQGAGAWPVDEDCDPVCTDEYAQYTRAMRAQALARRRSRRS